MICGDVDDGIGDSMYAGDIFVGGDLRVRRAPTASSRS